MHASLLFIRIGLGKGLKSMTFLEYRNNQFVECKGQPSTDITLKVDDAQKKLVLVVPGGVSMIQRRSAERAARGISKAGFMSSSGATLGRGYELLIEGQGGALPDRLKHSPREVY
jgi:hypothetical protein